MKGIILLGVLALVLLTSGCISQDIKDIFCEESWKCVEFRDTTHDPRTGEWLGKVFDISVCQEINKYPEYNALGEKQPFDMYGCRLNDTRYYQLVCTEEIKVRNCKPGQWDTPIYLRDSNCDLEAALCANSFPESKHCKFYELCKERGS